MYFGTISSAIRTSVDLFPERAEGDKYAATDSLALERWGQEEALELASVHTIEAGVVADDRAADAEFGRARDKGRGGFGHLPRHGDELEASMEEKRVLPDRGSTQGRTTATCNPRLPQATGRGGDSRASSLSISVHGMVRRPLGNAPTTENRDHAGRETSAALVGEARLCIPTTQTHAATATEPSQGAGSQEEAGRPKKGALELGCEFELFFEDEGDFHLHPHLTRMWMRRGQQVEVPSPGQNRKVPAFGAIDYASGMHVSHVPRTEKGGKNSAQFLRLLNKLRARSQRTGKKILLVLDNGPIHTAKRVSVAMRDPKLRACIRLLWLPKYAPELNEQERVWKVAKEQGVANVLFKDKDSFRDHVAKVLQSINKRKRGALTVLLGQHRRARFVPKNLRTGT